VGGLDPETNLIINGGGGNDTLQLSPVPFARIESFDGGAGSNTIEYTAVPVFSPLGAKVELQNGTAFLLGGIANVQNVIGSPR
jgi:hypothetical protein